MNDWDATSYAAEDNVLRIVRQEAEALFELVSGPDAWSAPTACPRRPPARGGKSATSSVT